MEQSIQDACLKKGGPLMFSGGHTFSRNTCRSVVGLHAITSDELLISHCELQNAEILKQ